MAKTLKQLVEQKQRIVQGRFQPEPAKKDIHAHTIVTPQMNEDEKLEEGRPDQRHPLEGHEYHKKSNAELIHIAKDAHKAAEAMKSHNTDAENKYRDQANDSATVRYFRQKNGMPDWYKKKYGHVNEETDLTEDQIEEIAGANMDTRAVHSHLKKRGWKLTRTSGGHDVYTHEKSSEHISVPRHKQLKAPLIMGILKSAKNVSEEVVEEQMSNDPFAPPYAKKTGTYADRIAKNTAISAAKKQAGTIKPNVSLANTYGESRKASIVREAIKDAQERDEKKKEKKEVTKTGKDKFQPDPELSSDIIRHE